MAHAPEQPSHRLAPGTLVGAWRVEAWQGQGAYGAVYRAVPVDPEHAAPVALKLSLYMWEARFGREAELLARLAHPSIPRLLGRGLLRYPSGAEHPFVVMEWVQGTSLYAWAEQHSPSGPQQCRVLAQLARALETLHAVGAVHRDVKGDNVLVRLLDRRAVLIDFGSCHFQGAARLTWQSLPPSTFAYQSTQACLFYLRSVRDRDSYYPPSPADDLYALGVTAYRLVMGDYPPPIQPHQDEQGVWSVTSPDPRPLLESNPRVEPLLREWILRLLSDAPEVRGTATQAAETLEAAADENVQTNASLPTSSSELSRGPKFLAGVRDWAPWLALATAGMCALLLWNWQPVPRHLSTSAPRASDLQVPDAGTAAVGETSPTVPPASVNPPSKPKPIAQQPPPEPRPGQARPDEKGRCPGRMQVAINGGCWVENPSMDAEACVESGYVFFNGRCYTHALAPPKKPLPTSSPAKER